MLIREGKAEPRAVYADERVVDWHRAPGRDWLERICAEHHIAHTNPARWTSVSVWSAAMR